MTSTNSSKATTTNETQRASKKRGCLFTIGRGVKWLSIALVMLLLLGIGYQALAVELDKRGYPPLGQLYTVNGHQMHIVCKGEGSPTVILQAGGVADSLWWYRLQNQLADHTRVCAFDRPGLGWSEAVSGAREARTIVEELHTLLQEAGISAPYVMAGHSYGAILTRVYTAQYPDQVVGIALVDSQMLNPKHFADQSEFEDWKSGFSGLDGLVGWMTRLGLTRLTSPSLFQNAGYPADIAREIAALQARNQVIETDAAEKLNGMWALTEASAAAEDLGAIPMVILWASGSIEGYDTLDAHAKGSQTRYADLRTEIATYSSNSASRLINGADHLSILGNESYAQQVTNAILDVIEAAETGEPLQSRSI